MPGLGGGDTFGAEDDSLVKKRQAFKKLHTYFLCLPWHLCLGRGQL